MIPLINLISHPIPVSVKCFARDDNDDDHDMPMTLSPAIREDAGDKN